MASVNRLFCCVPLAFRGGIIRGPVSSEEPPRKWNSRLKAQVCSSVWLLSKSFKFSCLLASFIDGWYRQCCCAASTCSHVVQVRQCDVIDWCWTTAQTTTVKVSTSTSGVKLSNNQSCILEEWQQRTRMTQTRCFILKLYRIRFRRLNQNDCWIRAGLGHCSLGPGRIEELIPSVSH